MRSTSLSLTTSRWALCVGRGTGSERVGAWVRFDNARSESQLYRLSVRLIQVRPPCPPRSFTRSFPCIYNFFHLVVVVTVSMYSTAAVHGHTYTSISLSLLSLSFSIYGTSSLLFAAITVRLSQKDLQMQIRQQLLQYVI